MRVTVRAGGLFVHHLPEDRDGESAVLDLPDGTTPAAVLERLNLPRSESYLIILNDRVVPSTEREATVIEDGDRLTIMPPIKGG